MLCGQVGSELYCAEPQQLRSLLGSAGHIRAATLTRPCLGCRLTSVNDDLAVATETTLSRKEVVSQLQRELWSEEQNTHPRER